MKSAKIDKADMRVLGKKVLYLTFHNGVPFTVTNWPGTLIFSVTGSRKGHHNIAGVRYDVWFVFDGYVWHGIQYGDNTQICHCKRTKERSLKENPHYEQYTDYKTGKPFYVEKS